jgi:hypothetical protein
LYLLLIVIIRLIAAVFLALFGSALHAAPVTALFFTSSPESWVGGGETLVVTPADGFDFQMTGSLGMIWLEVTKFGPPPNPQLLREFRLFFRPPAGEFIGVREYAETWDYNDPTVPVLEFHVDYRAAGGKSGWFRILQFDLVDYKVSALAADFVQFEYGNPKSGFWVLSVITLQYLCSRPKRVPAALWLPASP